MIILISAPVVIMTNFMIKKKTCVEYKTRENTVISFVQQTHKVWCVESVNENNFENKMELQ